MAVTKRDIVTWAELIQLVSQMLLAGVAALRDDDPIDFDSIKITVTPDEALRRLRETSAAKSENGK